MKITFDIARGITTLETSTTHMIYVYVLLEPFRLNTSLWQIL